MQGSVKMMSLEFGEKLQLENCKKQNKYIFGLDQYNRLTENDVKNKVFVVVAYFSRNISLVNTTKTFFPLTTNFSNLLLYLDCCIVICKPHDFTLHQKLMHEKYVVAYSERICKIGIFFVKIDFCKNRGNFFLIPPNII